VLLVDAGLGAGPEVALRELDQQATNDALAAIVEYELAGVVRYTHYALMVTGPYRIPIVDFFKMQATESLQHAQQAGEILTGLGGHPSLRIAAIDESDRHSLKHLLEESAAHEQQALRLYKDLLDIVQDSSVYLEEYARTMIGQEELHSIELRKMLRDYTD
jgi:bacterioferritin